MCLTRLIAAAFESSEPLHLLGLNGRVGAIPTYRVYRLYDSCFDPFQFFLKYCLAFIVVYKIGFGTAVDSGVSYKRKLDVRSAIVL